MLYTLHVIRFLFKRSIIRFVSVFAFSIIALSCAPPADKPNIVFIMVDDLGPEWISAYGSESIKTPNIDRLAAQGLRFNNAYSMPQCTPTRVTLLTGQYPFRHGWTNHWDVPRWGAGAHFDPSQNLSFARLFQGAGYKTAAAGKWQINDFRVQPDAMTEHGFDEYAMWTGYETLNPPSAERYQDPYIHTRQGSQTYKDMFGPDVYTDFLIDFIHANKQHPMLIYFPMALTHPPMIPTPHEPDAEGIMDRHKAMTRYMDHLVGRLINTLDELDLRKNTYIFFTTDNGTSRGIDGIMNGRLVRGGKGSLGENGMHAPFIVSAPGRIPEETTTDILMDFSDLFPTFLDLAHITIPDTLILDGVSFASNLETPASEGQRKWILSMGFGPAKLTEQGVQPVKPFTDRAVRDHRYKLWIEEGQSTALYDLEIDPGETNNLIESPDLLHKSAKSSLEAIIQSLPSNDASPRYFPLPPQVWDRSPENSPG